MTNSAGASPFSFHCMICFEEFDTERRYPVVLPCGHTYVCCACAERLDRCMECRVSLFAMQSKLPANALQQQQAQTYQRRHTVHARSAGRNSDSRSNSYGRQPLQHGQPQGTLPLEKVRLPLPKNAVLLSLMEATELVASESSNHQHYMVSSSLLGEAGIGASFTSAGSDRASMDEYEQEEEKIKLSTSIATGACGTYAVATRAGLTIHATRPYPTHISTKTPISKQLCEIGASHEEVEITGSGSMHENDLDELSNGTDNAEMPPASRLYRAMSNIDRDVDTIIKAAASKQFDGGSCGSLTGSPFRKKVAVEREGGSDYTVSTSYPGILSVEGVVSAEEMSVASEQLLKLSYGDRVQVVAMDVGWAKLARGYGFVYCKEGNELVKVGGSVDKACRLEAMLHTLALRRNDLKRQQGEVDRASIGLMRDLQLALMKDEDLTVIAAATFENPRTSFDEDSAQGSHSSKSSDSKNKALLASEEISKKGRSTSHLKQTLLAPEEINKKGRSTSRLKQPIGLQRPDSTPLQERNSFTCFAKGVLGDLYDRACNSNDENRQTSNIHPQSRTSSNDSSSMKASAARLFQSKGSDPSHYSDEVERKMLFMAGKHPHPSSMSAGAVEWRRRNGKEAARGIDFRTGMSGHHAVHSTYTHPHEFIKRPTTERRMMSAHSGLTLGSTKKSIFQRMKTG